MNPPVFTAQLTIGDTARSLPRDWPDWVGPQNSYLVPVDTPYIIHKFSARLGEKGFPFDAGITDMTTLMIGSHPILSPILDLGIS